MSYGNGIKLTAGFDVGAKTPLDSKSVVQTIAERDAFVTDNLVYEGLEVYVKDTGHKYRYNGTSWIDLDAQSGSESGTGEGLTTEQANQLTTAYEHSQSAHVQYSDIPTKISDLENDSNFINTIPEEYITVTELEAKGYLTSHQDISNLQSKTDNNLATTSKEVVGAINEVKSSVDGITVPTKTSDLTNDSGFITSIPSEYITETELETKGYLTEHQSLTDYAKKTDIPDVSDFLTEVPAEYVTDTKLSTELDKKVNKEVGKGLSTNDLTNELITKINSSATEAFVTNAIANAQLGSGEVDLSGYATIDALNLKADLTHTHDQYLTKVPDEYITETELNAKGYLTEHQDISNLALKSEIPDVSSFITSDDLPTVPTKVSDLANDKNYISSIPSEYVTETELETKGYLTSHQDISGLQTKTDNSLITTDKTVIGAINEISGTQLDTVSFSADYKNIILNRKNGLNPYTIPIASIINNASLTELKDIDSTDIGNGKTIVYDSVTQKHKYVNTTLTDELVKMDSATDAHYLSDLIDKSTVVNDNGVLKVKKLDGQEVTITEINYLKGLTMNVMDLVSAFSNGGVKVWETPVSTYSDLETLDRSTFIDEVSYIVYVLIDETHSNAKTTYLCTKTSTTFFGNADNQRNFTTNPIDLANEVTGKLDNRHFDVDSLWTLLTINDTYKTLTTNNEIFGTHGAKALYDELTTYIGEKANATDLTTHTEYTDIHVTTTDKAKWDKVIDKVDTTDFNSLKTKVDEKANTSDIPTKVSELTNDSNYQTAKQVNSAVTTEIAKVETELKGNIKEINDSLVDKAEIDDTSTSALDATWSASKIYSAINSIGFKGNAPENAKSATTPGVYLINRSDDAYPVTQGYLIVSKPRQDYGCILQEVYNFNANVIYLRGCWFDSWYDWTKLATMDNTKDVGVTTITPVNSAITGTIEYTVKNGICYVSMKDLMSTIVTTNLLISTTMPKPSVNCTCSVASLSSSGNIAMIYIDKNTAKLNGDFYMNNAKGRCSFSYPVAES